MNWEQAMFDIEMSYYYIETKVGTSPSPHVWLKSSSDKIKKYFSV